jgi:hypothetical protein
MTDAVSQNILLIRDDAQYAAAVQKTLVKSGERVFAIEVAAEFTKLPVIDASEAAAA